MTLPLDRHRLHHHLLPIAVALVLHAATLVQVSASGKFQMEVDRWSNKFEVTSDGLCCEGAADTESIDCPGPCRTFLTVCLSHFQVIIPDHPDCTYGSVVTAADHFTNQNQVSGIDIPFEFAWPGSFTVIVEAWHDETGHGPSPGSDRTLIWRLKAQRLINATSVIINNSSSSSSSWMREEFHLTSPLLAPVTYRYRVVCDSDFHGLSCSEYCKPRDDRFGHYDCNSSGNKLCHTGWIGTYCQTPVCREGCQGYCREPSECRCRQGWTGASCDQCVTTPGCQHGYCVRPWQCICHQGWAGDYCNHDVDVCSSRQPCELGATCRNDGDGSYSCLCPPGYSGTHCERDLRDCRHRLLACLHDGTCQYNAVEMRYECQCVGDAVGARCESTAGCRQLQQPCRNGGVCVAEPRDALTHCLCPPAFTGRFCEVNVDDCASQPCVHGGCVDERNGFRCVCERGYSGRRCNEDVDDCRTLRGPCLNGGQCVDGLDTFTCRCPAGYTGQLCQFPPELCRDCGVDRSSLSPVDCRSSPCMNGASCVNTLDDKLRFRCICRRRFRGRRCHVQVSRRRHQPPAQFSVSASSSSSPGLTVADVSTVGGASTAQSVNYGQQQRPIVVVLPLAPAAVVAVLALLGSSAACVCWYRGRRYADTHHRPTRPTARWIHNDVGRPSKKNASSVTSVSRTVASVPNAYNAAFDRKITAK